MRGSTIFVNRIVAAPSSYEQDGNKMTFLTQVEESASPSPADIAAIESARKRTASFREDMTARAGGMYDRNYVANLLSITPATVERRRKRRQLLGVPYGKEFRYPAAQFVGGGVVPGLKAVLEAFDDTHPWEQLMMLVTPLEGYAGGPGTLLEILSRPSCAGALPQLTGLVASWVA